MDSIPVIIIRLPQHIDVVNIWQNLQADTLELEVMYLEAGMLKLKTIRPPDLKPMEGEEKNPRF